LPPDHCQGHRSPHITSLQVCSPHCTNIPPQWTSFRLSSIVSVLSTTVFLTVPFPSCVALYTHECGAPSPLVLAIPPSHCEHALSALSDKLIHASLLVGRTPTPHGALRGFVVVVVDVACRAFPASSMSVVYAVLHGSTALSGSAKLRLGRVLPSREAQGTSPLLRNHVRLWGQPWPQRLSDERHELRQLSSALFIGAR